MTKFDTIKLNILLNPFFQCTYETSQSTNEETITTRLKEHKINIKLDSSKLLVVSEHEVLNLNYFFDWENVKF